jgi:hypothetical protein
MWFDDGSCADCAANANANCRSYGNAYSNADCYSRTDATPHTEYVHALWRREMF